MNPFYVVAVDPGKESCACAGFRAGVLTAVWFQPVTLDIGIGRLPAERLRPLVVVERPQIDGRTVDPRVLIDLTRGAYLVATAYAAQLECSVQELTPAEWKGSLAKPIHHGRFLPALTADERRVLPADTDAEVWCAKQRWATRHRSKRKTKITGAEAYGSWTGHNLLDAIGLGLFALGRIDKTGEPIATAKE